MPTTTAPSTPHSRREAVLRGVAGSRWDAEDAERRTFLTTLEWGRLNTVDGGRLPSGYVLPGTDTSVRLAGLGTPRVADSCIAELGAALRVSTDAARSYLADTMEAAHRLPVVFDRLAAGEVVVWRVRALTRLTIPLTPETAAVVDARIAPFLPKLSAREIKRYVAAIVADTAPGELGAAGPGSPDVLVEDTRHATFSALAAGHPGELLGLMHLDADLDFLDAVHLDRAIDAGAAHLAGLGAQGNRNVLRSKALGELASGYARLPLITGEPGQAGETAGTDDQPAAAVVAVQPQPVAAPARDVTLVVHLDPDHPLVATLDQPGQRDAPVLTNVVREWCTGPDATIIIKPVIDTRVTVESAGYVPSPRLRELVLLRERTCVFPHCHRPSAICDLDHVIPWRDGGPTSSRNLAPLCRKHHRLKTHHGWHYAPLDPGQGATGSTAGPPGTYLWRTPTGEQILRTPFGATHTRPADPIRPARPARPATPAA